MRTYILDGTWTLSANKPEPNNYDIKDGSSFEMLLPGSVQDALIAQMVVPDPYYADNELETMFIGRSDWNISRTFEMKRLNAKAHYILKLEKVDTIATLFINDMEVERFDNEHRIFFIDISKFIREGANTMEFRFTASEKTAVKRSEELPYPVPCSHYMYDSPHRNLVRKAQCNAAWDWGLCLQTIGVYESIVVYESEKYMLQSFSAVPKPSAEPKPNGDVWNLEIEANIEAFEDCSATLGVLVGCDLETSVAESVQEITLAKGFNKTRTTVEVPREKVELWWPNGYGSQPLYDVQVELSHGKLAIERLCATQKLKRRIGFRTIEVKNNVTMGGKELTVCVNGQDVFCKGANWIPLDARPGRMTTQRFDDTIKAAKDANMNMLRVWGGGWYEKEAFYDACDKYGILLWHDLMFSCSTYPAQDWFLESVEHELRDQMRRLKGRTCIALWCGNNECLGALNWYEESRNDRPRYLKDYEKLYTNWIDRIMREEDPDRMYWPSSPCAGPGDYSDNWHSDGNGDMHYWTVWHERKDFEYYHNVKPRFCSEFGYQSFPSLSEVLSFAPDDQLNLTSPIMEHHQRNEEGNSIIIEMFTRYFRMPYGVANQLYLSQVQQALAIQTAVTYWRSLMPYCMGTLYWQLNDVWPVSSWSSIEYSGKWKALHYAARRFYNPVAPLLFIDGHSVHVKVANDNAFPIKADVSVSLIRYDGMPVLGLHRSVEVGSLSVGSIWDYELSNVDVNDTYLLVGLSYQDEDEVRHDCYEEALLLTRPKAARIEDSGLSIESVSKVHNGFDVTISCERPAFFVVLDAGDIKGRFEDNMFSLNGTKTIRFECHEEGVSEKKFSETLGIYDLYSSSKEKTL